MIINEKDSKKVAEILISIHAVKLQPYNFFTWTSGKKSPIYCDNRIVLSNIKARKIIRNLFCSYIKKHFQSVNYVAGVATGAIAHGMMIASKLDLPFIYVRDKAKNYGREKGSVKEVGSAGLAPELTIAVPTLSPPINNCRIASTPYVKGLTLAIT